MATIVVKKQDSNSSIGSGSRVQLGPATQRMRSASQNRIRRLSATSEDLNGDSSSPGSSKEIRKRGPLWRKLSRKNTKGDTRVQEEEKPRKKSGSKSKHKSNGKYRDISNPTDVKQLLHATFDPNRMRFSGLPDEWRSNGALAQFGVDLNVCPKVAIEGYESKIPAVLVVLRNELLKFDGLRVEGVFRVSANKADQDEYREAIDRGTFRGCTTKDDSSCMASLIKEWFRCLPEPLLNSLPRDAVYKAAKASDKKSVDKLFKNLTQPNRSIFFWLLDLLAEAAKEEKYNRMNAKALGIVLAPNLYNVPETASPMELVAMMESIVKVVHQALNNRIASINRGSIKIM